MTRRSSQERTHLRAVTRGAWAVLLFGPPSPSHDDRVRVATRHLGEDVTVARIVSTRSLTAPERWPDVAGRHGAASEILLEDHEGVVAASYRPHGDESMVVRPDGHLGWRSSRSSQDLDAWLRRVLGGHRLIELAP